MTRQIIIGELKNKGVNFNRIRFYKKSPYQKRRYMSEYVGWEAWIYTNTMTHGFLITQEDWENNRQNIIEAI